MRIIITWPTASPALADIAIAAAFDQAVTELPAGFLTLAADRTDHEHRVALTLSRRAAREMESEQMLTFLTTMLTYIGPGAYSIRGFERRPPAFLSSVKPGFLSWHPALLWGIPVTIVFEPGSPPLLEVSWSFVSRFVRRAAPDKLDPERIMYSSPIRRLLESISSIIAIRGDHQILISQAREACK